METLPDLLKTLVEMDGSDLHIATNTPPQTNTIPIAGKIMM